MKLDVERVVIINGGHLDRLRVGDTLRFYLSDGELIRALKVEESDDKSNYYDTYIFLDCLRDEYKHTEMNKCFNSLFKKIPDWLKSNIRILDNAHYFRLATEKEIYGVNYYSDTIESDIIKQWTPMMDRRNRIALSLNKGECTWWWLSNEVDKVYIGDEYSKSYSTVSSNGDCYYLGSDSLCGVRPVFQVDKGYF